MLANSIEHSVSESVSSTQEDDMHSEPSEPTDHLIESFNHSRDKDITSKIDFVPNNYSTVPLSSLEWEAGVLLMLRQKFFLPFEALFIVSKAIRDFHTFNELLISFRKKWKLYLLAH